MSDKWKEKGVNDNNVTAVLARCTTVTPRHFVPSLPQKFIHQDSF